MNWIRARCRRASGPVMTAKRAPEIRLAALEIQLPELFAQLDMITRFEAEFGRLTPATNLKIVVFGLLPSGTSSANRLGSPISMSLSSPCTSCSCARWPRDAPRRSFTAASNGSMSSPCALALPMLLALVLRSFCRVLGFNLQRLAALIESKVFAVGIECRSRAVRDWRQHRLRTGVVIWDQSLVFFCLSSCVRGAQCRRVSP